MSVPDTQDAVDGTPLPTMRAEIPAELRKVVGQVCVLTEVKDGPRYRVVTTAFLDRTIARELGLSAWDLVPFRLWFSLLRSMLSTSPIGVEKFYDATTEDGHPVQVVLLYSDQGMPAAPPS